MSRWKDVPPTTVKMYGQRFMDFRIQEKWNIPDKIALRCAVTGSFIDKEQNPNQPIEPEEIMNAASGLIEAGATAIHLHARGDKGLRAKTLDYFAELLNRLKAKYGYRVVYDGEAQMGDTFEEAHAPIRMGLYEIAPVIPHVGNLGDTIRVTPIPTMKAQAEHMMECGVKPEITVHDTCSIDNARRYLIGTGILEKPYTWLILPGLPGIFYMPNESAMVEGLPYLVRRIREIDKESVITVCNAGRGGLYVSTLAMLLGCHVRVGMEDQLYRYPHKDQLVQSNLEVFNAAKTIAQTLGREPATADEFRKLAGIKKR